MLKLNCERCGFICRASATAIAAAGLPTCGCGAVMDLPAGLFCEENGGGA